jgi:hypothetical protein
MTKITKKNAWNPFPPFFKMLAINCPKQPGIVHLEKKGRKN